MGEVNKTLDLIQHQFKVDKEYTMKRSEIANCIEKYKQGILYARNFSQDKLRANQVFDERLNQVTRVNNSFNVHYDFIPE